jgi:signal transduction histidine kinase
MVSSEPKYEPASTELPDHLTGRILIVDDQPLNVALIEKVLRKEGYTAIASTSDSRDAVALYREYRPDLLLLDINMPHLDGFQVMEALKEVEPELFLPILVLTGDTDQAVRLRALESGAKDFLTKPFDALEILSRVRILLEMRMLQDRLRDYNRHLEIEVDQRTEKLQGVIDVLRQAERKLADRPPEESPLARHFDAETVANLTHELRTPLNVILGYAEILKNEASGPSGNTRHAAFAGNIWEACTHILGIVNDFLDLSQVEAGKLDLDIHDVDVAGTVGSSVKLLAQQAETANVSLTVDIPDDFPALRTDERRFRQALLNVITNAIKFTPAGGSVTVKGRYKPEDGAMIFVISDCGIGISAEDIPLVMSAFGQAKRAGARRHKGSGLGLPLTKKLIETLGGRFNITSQVGLGTIVTISFPPELVKTD